MISARTLVVAVVDGLAADDAARESAVLEAGPADGHVPARRERHVGAAPLAVRPQRTHVPVITGRRARPVATPNYKNRGTLCAYLLYVAQRRTNYAFSVKVQRA